MEQMNMFDFIESDRFCFDDDINTLVEMIEKEFQILIDEGLLGYDGDKKFTIWDHVKNNGYRLSMSYKIVERLEGSCQYRQRKVMEMLENINIDKLISYARKHNIELSISPTPFGIYISTLYLDKRRKINGL